jgi:hypothetical protein
LYKQFLLVCGENYKSTDSYVYENIQNLWLIEQFLIKINCLKSADFFHYFSCEMQRLGNDTEDLEFGEKN